MTPSIPSLKLNNGNSIPAVGIGCWMGRVGEGQHVVEMVKKALKMGYRHIDTVCDLMTFQTRITRINLGSELWYVRAPMVEPSNVMTRQVTKNL